MKLTAVATGLREVQAGLRGFSDRRLAATMATALTRTAVEVRKQVQQRLPSIFDRPTPYTINSLFVKPATAQRLEAEVFFKDEIGTSRLGTPATKYLLPEVRGGARRSKAFEKALRMAGYLPAGRFAVPGAGAKIDHYGNMDRGQIIQILSQLRITLTAGHTRNLGFGRKGIAAQRKAGGRFFVKRNKRGKAEGVYQREFSGRNVTPVVVFVRAPSYRARFDFDGIASTIAQQQLPREVERALGEQVARLQARGG